MFCRFAFAFALLCSVAPLSAATETISFANESEQHTYWSGATAFNCMSLIALAWMGFEYYRNTALHARAMLVFVGQLGGALIFIGSYFPYHVGNLARGALSGPSWCKAATMLASASIWLTSVSNALIRSKMQIQTRDEQGMRREDLSQCRRNRMLTSPLLCLFVALG